MPALQLDVTIEQGATFQRSFTCTAEATGEPIDFSGYEFIGELKTLAGVKVADFVISTVGNVVTAEIPEDVSLLIPATTSFQHRYFVKATKAGAPDYRIANGKALISGE